MCKDSENWSNGSMGESMDIIRVVKVGAQEDGKNDNDW